MSDWLDKEARNETVFRELNEWIVDGVGMRSNGARPDGEPAASTFICECSDQRCTAPITVSRGEYETVRAEPTWFVIAANHENPEIDRVVSENARFAIVEKIDSAATTIARQTDPRR